MAGAALTTPLLVRPREIIGRFPIKSAEVVNVGDLVALDSNGQVVVASKTAGAVIRAEGVAFFTDELAGNTSRTGVAGLTVMCSIARRARVSNFSGLTIGGRLYLDAAPTGGADNYTQTLTSTNGDAIQCVGTAISATEADVAVEQNTAAYQTAGNSTANNA